MNTSNKKQPGDIILEDINIQSIINFETKKLYNACKLGDSKTALDVLNGKNIPGQYSSSIDLIDYSKKFYLNKNIIGETIIMCAIRNNLDDVIERLLEIFKTNFIKRLFPITYEQRYGINTKIYKGRTILMLVCEYDVTLPKHRHIFLLLLASSKVDINLIGDDGLDAFAIACLSGNRTFATFFVDSNKFIPNEYKSNKFDIKTFLEKKEGFSYIKRIYEEKLIKKKFNILKENFTVNSPLMKNYRRYLYLLTKK